MAVFLPNYEIYIISLNICKFSMLGSQPCLLRHKLATSIVYVVCVIPHYVSVAIGITSQTKPFQRQIIRQMRRVVGLLSSQGFINL